MEIKDKSLHIILDGRFSKNGNFLGIDSKGLKLHIYKKLMDALNLKCYRDIKFPLFAIGRVETFNKLTGELGDEDRQLIINPDGTKATFDRLTGMSVFSNIDKLKYALYSGITLMEEASKNIKLNRERRLKELEDKKEFYRKQLEDYIKSSGLEKYDGIFDDLKSFEVNDYDSLDELSDIEKQTIDRKKEMDKEFDKFHQHYIECMTSRNISMK